MPFFAVFAVRSSAAASAAAAARTRDCGSRLFFPPAPAGLGGGAVATAAGAPAAGAGSAAGAAGCVATGSSSAAGAGDASPGSARVRARHRSSAHECLQLPFGAAGLGFLPGVVLCCTNGGFVAAGQSHVASIHDPSNADAPVGGSPCVSLLETRTRTRYRSVSLLPTHVPVIDPCSSTRMDAASNLFLPSISVDALLYVASRATHCEWSAEWDWEARSGGSATLLLKRVGTFEAFKGGAEITGGRARVSGVSLTRLIDSGRSMAVGFGSRARSSDHSDDAIAPAPPRRVTV